MGCCQGSWTLMFAILFPLVRYVMSTIDDTPKKLDTVLCCPWISNHVTVSGLVMFPPVLVCNIRWMVMINMLAISINFRFVKGKIAVNNGNYQLSLEFPLVQGDLCVLAKGSCSRLESSIGLLQKPASVSLWIKCNFSGIDVSCECWAALLWFLSNCEMTPNVGSVAEFGIYFGVSLSVSKCMTRTSVAWVVIAV